jgi:hypothetical protein
MEQTLTEKLQRIKELNDQVRLDSIEYNEKLVELGLDQLQGNCEYYQSLINIQYNDFRD